MNMDGSDVEVEKVGNVEIVKGFSLANYDPANPDLAIQSLGVPNQQAEIIDATFQHLPPKRKKKSSSVRRVEELLFTKDNLEHQNMFLNQAAIEKEAIIAEQRQKIQEYEQALVQAAQERNRVLEQNLDDNEDTVNREIKRAKEEGDINEEIRLINELADIKARKNINALNQEQAQREAFNRQREIQEEEYIPIETPIMQQATVLAQFDDEMQDWIEENPWYVQNPKLKAEADEVADLLANQYHLRNESHLINTSQFLDNVKSVVQSRYGVQPQPQQQYYEEEQEYDQSYDQQMNPMQRFNQQLQKPLSNPGYRVPTPSPVAPVTRPGISMADQYIQNSPQSRYGGMPQSLTKEELAIAKHFPRKQGQTEQDIIKMLADAKNFPKSKLPGGSPYRLTFD